MHFDKQSNVINLLQTTVCGAGQSHLSQLDQLDEEERAFLRSIATGAAQTALENVRLNAIKALRYFTADEVENVNTLKHILNDPDPVMQLVSFQTIQQMDVAELPQIAQAILQDVNASLLVAIPAAESLANQEGAQNTPLIQGLHDRIVLTYGEEEHTTLPLLHQWIGEG